MKLKPLIADKWKIDGGMAFRVLPKSIWSRKNEPDENIAIEIPISCLLLVQNDNKLLIDTGPGNKRIEKYYDVCFRGPAISLWQSSKKMESVNWWSEKNDKCTR